VAVVSFRLARMDFLIRLLTLALLALPPMFVLIALLGNAQRDNALLGNALLFIPTAVLIAVYVWIALWFRPTRFVVGPRALEIVWPLRRREIPREDIMAVRLLDKHALQREVGRSMRVGAGGLGGGFGWLWTQKRGVVRMYVSRTDGLVWIERRSERPWLITPEQPETFVRSLSS
jgi:hypothetical protein